MVLPLFVRNIAVYSMLSLSFSQVSCSGKISPAAVPATRPVASVINLERDILSYVNEYRSEKGLTALEMQAAISLEAETHSKDMAAGKTAFGHDGFENRIKIISKKMGSLVASAENVAYGNLTARQVVDGWIKSPGHRKNMEGKYTITGIGISQRSDGVIFFTQIFARGG